MPMSGKIARKSGPKHGPMVPSFLDPEVDIYIYINTVFEDISTSIYDGNILGRFRMLSGIDIGGIIIVMIIMKPLHNWLTPW